jgi:membrane associated rhomboid family serine protease
MHLLANSLSLFLYLMPVEQKLKNACLYLCILLPGGMYLPTYHRIGNMLSITVYNLTNRTLLAVGASTSICSVIGFDFAYRLLRINNQPLQPRRLLITLLYLLLISLLPGVDFFGHFGSLAAGFLIGGSFLKPSPSFWKPNYVVFIRLIGRAVLIAYIGVLAYFIAKYQK